MSGVPTRCLRETASGYREVTASHSPARPDTARKARLRSPRGPVRRPGTEVQP